MIIDYVLKGSIVVPDGSTLSEESNRMIILPDGSWIKPFIVLELNDEQDLTYNQTVDIECDILDESIELEIYYDG